MEHEHIPQFTLRLNLDENIGALSRKRGMKPLGGKAPFEQKGLKVK